MKNSSTQNRKNNRKRMPNSDVKKQNAVVGFWKKKLEEYQEMTMEQLEAIKEDKRSRTDKHAYDCAIIAKKDAAK